MVSENAELAQKVREEDTVIDRLNDQVFRELLTFMMENTHKIPRFRCTSWANLQKPGADRRSRRGNCGYGHLHGYRQKRPASADLRGEQMKIRLFTKLLIAFVATGILVVTISSSLIERQLESGLIDWSADEMAAAARILALMPNSRIAGQAIELAEVPAPV